MREILGNTHQTDVTLPVDSAACGNHSETANNGPESLELQGTRPAAFVCQDGPYTGQEKSVAGEHPRNAPGTRLIPLSRGLFAVVSAQDFERVNRFKWNARLDSGIWYAVREIPAVPGRRGRGRDRMHRFILGVAPWEMVDHKDGNGLNNTRENLRKATSGENARNVRKPAHGVTSTFKGVSWHEKARKYQATVRFQRKNHYLGLFTDPAEAAWAYDREARKLHGAFARCNFPPPPMILEVA